MSAPRLGRSSALQKAGMRFFRYIDLSVLLPISTVRFPRILLSGHNPYLHSATRGL